MSNKYNLSEYHFAKKVCKDFPLIQKEIDIAYKMLYPYREYLAVQHILDSLSDSREMMVRQYKSYKEVLKKKGKDE